MDFDLDTDHLLAVAKGHHRAIRRQAELDVLARRAVLRRRVQAPAHRRTPGLVPGLRQCWRALGRILGVLPQRRVLVARVLANEELARGSNTSKGMRACRAVE